MGRVGVGAPLDLPLSQYKDRSRVMLTEVGRGRKGASLPSCTRKLLRDAISLAKTGKEGPALPPLER